MAINSATGPAFFSREESTIINGITAISCSIKIPKVTPPKSEFSSPLSWITLETIAVDDRAKAKAIITASTIANPIIILRTKKIPREIKICNRPITLTIFPKRLKLSTFISNPTVKSSRIKPTLAKIGKNSAEWPLIKIPKMTPARM